MIYLLRVTMRDCDLLAVSKDDEDLEDFLARVCKTANGSGRRAMHIDRLQRIVGSDVTRIDYDPLICVLSSGLLLSRKPTNEADFDQYGITFEYKGTEEVMMPYDNKKIMDIWEGV